MTILGLMFRFLGDNSDFKSKVRETEHSVEGLSSKLTHGFHIAATALGGHFIFHKLEEAMVHAAHLKDIQERMDVSAESLQRYANSARRGSTDIDNIAQNIDRLKKALGTAMGNDSAAKSMRDHFSALGIELEDIKTKSPEEVFNLLMKSAGDGTMSLQQFAAASEILGKRFGSLIPFAKDLAKANHDLMFSDKELSTLQKADHAFSDLFNNIKIGVGKAALGIQTFGGRLTSLFYGQPGAYDIGEKDEARQEEEDRKNRSEMQKAADELAAKNAMQQKEEDVAQDHRERQAQRAAELDEQSEKLGEKSRFKELSDEEKVNELLERRAKLKEAVAFYAAHPDMEKDAEQAEKAAEARRELAENAQQLQEISGRNKNDIVKPEVDSLARKGIFIGGTRDPLVTINERQLRVTEQVRDVLNEIKKQPRREMFD